MSDVLKVALHTQNEIRFTSQAEIMYCKSDDCYTVVHLYDGESIMISKSLTKFSKELNTESFARISQSFLVNKSVIKQIHKKSKEIELLNQARIPFTTTLHKLLILINSRLLVFLSGLFQALTIEA